MNTNIVSIGELEAEIAEPVPAREALSLLNLNAIIAANVAVAANALSVDSTAVATATQGIWVYQS